MYSDHKVTPQKPAMITIAAENAPQFGTGSQTSQHFQLVISRVWGFRAWPYPPCTPWDHPSSFSLSSFNLARITKSPTGKMRNSHLNTSLCWLCQCCFSKEHTLVDHIHVSQSLFESLVYLFVLVSLVTHSWDKDKNKRLEMSWFQLHYHQRNIEDSLIKPEATFFCKLLSVGGIRYLWLRIPFQFHSSMEKMLSASFWAVKIIFMIQSPPVSLQFKLCRPHTAEKCQQTESSLFSW